MLKLRYLLAGKYYLLHIFTKLIVTLSITFIEIMAWLMFDWAQCYKRRNNIKKYYCQTVRSGTFLHSKD